MRTVVLDILFVLLGITLANWHTFKSLPLRFIVWRRNRKMVLLPFTEEDRTSIRKMWKDKEEGVAPHRPAPGVLLEDACLSVWLHGNFKWLTSKMTTDEREVFADAVDRARVRLDAQDGGIIEDRVTPIERWWKEEV